MSEQPQGEHWWCGDDGRWYAPEQRSSLPPPPSDYVQHAHGRPVAVRTTSAQVNQQSSSIRVLEFNELQRQRIRSVLLTSLVAVLVVVGGGVLYWLINNQAGDSTPTIAPELDETVDVVVLGQSEIAPESSDAESQEPTGDQAESRELAPLDRTIPTIATGRTPAQNLANLHQLRAVLIAGPITECEFIAIDQYLAAHDDVYVFDANRQSELLLYIDVAALTYRHYMDLTTNPDAHALAQEYVDVMEGPTMEKLMLWFFNPEQLSQHPGHVAATHDEITAMSQRIDQLEDALRSPTNSRADIGVTC